jgi:hypothetical protein
MKRTLKLPMRLLPKVPGQKLENAAIDADTVSLTLASTSLPAACYLCSQKVPADTEAVGNDLHQLALGA